MIHLNATTTNKTLTTSLLLIALCILGFVLKFSMDHFSDQYLLKLNSIIQKEKWYPNKFISPIALNINNRSLENITSKLEPKRKPSEVTYL